MKKIKLNNSHFIITIAFIVLASLLVFIFFYYYSDREVRAGLTALEISTLPSKVAVDSAQTVTITAKDDSEVYEDYGGTVHFSSTDASATLPSDYTFKNNSKEKAISVNGWNEELKEHDYDSVTTKLANNNIENAYLGVYETTGVGSGFLFCENDFGFAGVTSDNYYDLNDFITSATGNGVDTYAWITIFGPAQTLDIDEDGQLEYTWVDPESSEHLTFINNLASHLLTNYSGLKGIVIDYIRYTDPPASNQDDGDNIDEAEYRVYEDGGTYTDHTGNFAPGNATTIVSNVVQSIAATVHGFANKEIATETYSAHNDSVYNWIQSDLGQDYALFAPNIDFLVPLAYHIGWYEASWVAEVVNYVYGKVNPVNPNCEIWPKIQTWQENKSIGWPGAVEIEDAVEPIDYAKVGGLGFYVYDHTSDEEWTEVRDCFDDNGIKTFKANLSLNQLGTFDLKVEDESLVVSETQSGIEVFYGHTNGTLIQATGDPAVYYLDGIKRHIPNPSVFEANFHWKDIVQINAVERDSYVNGPLYTYPDSTLLKGSGPEVYVLEGGQRRHIISPAVFNGLGYSWGNIKIISNSELNQYSEGDNISNTTTHPNGSLVKAVGDAAVYLINKDRKSHIPSPKIFNTRFRWENIITISTNEKDTYPNGPAVKFPDGTLIKNNSPEVYVLENNQKRHIPSPGIFQELGYKWSNILVVSESRLSDYPDGEKIVAEQFADYSTVIYGDSRSGHTMHQKLVNYMIQTDPEVVLHTGDLVSTGDSATDWDYFNNITNELRSNTAFYPSIGNHELPVDTYLANFELPNNERWYSVEDNGVHYIVLDSTSDIDLGSTQYTWLEADLNGIGEDINFTVVVFHHPPFTTGSHPEDEKDFKTNVVPLFESKGVDLVFNGHNHSYERSLYHGIRYIVTAGGGAPLYNQARSSDYSELYIKDYNFCRIQVTDDYLKVQTFNDDFSQIDEFLIGENPPVAFYSDNQSDSDADDARHQAVADWILNTAGNPVFHAGDLQEDGTADSLNRFNTVTSTLRAERDFYAAIGNNDSNSSLYFDNFEFPGNERWYSVNVGNLHMVILDTTYSSTAPGSEQYNWLESDLQSDDSQNRITGVMFHYPVYNNSGDAKGLINTVVPLFRDHGVDFVMAGHIHQYKKEIVDGIYYITNSGQTTLGYMIANILENEVWLNVYNSSNSLTDTIIFDER